MVACHCFSATNRNSWMSPDSVLGSTNICVTFVCMPNFVYAVPRDVAYRRQSKRAEMFAPRYFIVSSARPYGISQSVQQTQSEIVNTFPVKLRIGFGSLGEFFDGSDTFQTSSLILFSVLGSSALALSCPVLFASCFEQFWSEGLSVASFRRGLDCRAGFVSTKFGFWK